ncbi:hypothetical protein DAEQUDRAFT_746297 [Daedalea quercina L-15889]|uniref:Probable RNA polymerase II nuclear localization protein SLC7A6OS n=1 Tax=Daedalea quercina L-15889 TaxID=1314783 RepID=A0A165NLK8_9APHY|nr:hypothetical protein DAEQUDRAFT_746297 [Daedalea quercina L-15889]
MSATEPAQIAATDAPEQQRPYAILRIKRKRNEEPLDGLLVNQDVPRPKGKRSRAGLNFFKFAETVEQGAWEDEQAKRDLEAVMPASKSAPADMGQIASPTTPTEPPAKRSRPNETPRKYTVLKREVPSTDPQVRRRIPSAPPKVWSMKELEAARAAQAQLTVYEAVPSSSGLAASTSVDPEVAKFLPLLQEYLKLEDTVAAPPATTLIPPTKEDDEDYVYDVFYQRLTRSPSAMLGNVGTLTDVPDELTLYDSDDDDDSEVYSARFHESDDWCTAEDWYQNDYPDEESDRDDDGSEGSDIFHDGSDHEDMMYDNDDDHEWR